MKQHTSFLLMIQSHEPGTENEICYNVRYIIYSRTACAQIMTLDVCNLNSKMERRVQITVDKDDLLVTLYSIDPPTHTHSPNQHAPPSTRNRLAAIRKFGTFSVCLLYEHHSESWRGLTYKRLSDIVG